MGMTDGERFSAIYRAHLGEVLAYARRRVGSPEEAEEVAAEVFAVAWRRLDDVPRRPLPWLYGVARNTVLNQRRTERRRGALVRALEHDQGLRAGSLAERAAPAVEPEGRLTRAMDTLGADEREALLLIAWEEMTHREAAAAMGMSRVGFTRLVARARRGLADALGEVLPQGTSLANPLPDSVVVSVEDGAVRLDPAAPVGHDPQTGQVWTFATDPDPSLTDGPLLFSCQVLVDGSDPAGGACPERPGVEGTRVQESSGRWRVFDTGVVGSGRAMGSTQVSLLARPITESDALPRPVVTSLRAMAQGPSSPYARHGLRLQEARLAMTAGDGDRYWVVPGANDILCPLRAQATGGFSLSCNAQSLLAERGALVQTAHDLQQPTVVWGLVADGYRQVRVDGGTREAISGNFFSVQVPSRGGTVTLSGPAGTRNIAVK